MAAPSQGQKAVTKRKSETLDGPDRRQTIWKGTG
nr:MAG TPA: hypothetical protein [Caudoviricetes sp.]